MEFNWAFKGLIQRVDSSDWNNARPLDTKNANTEKQQHPSIAWLEFEIKISVHKGRNGFREDPILLHGIY
jgi:hypothetical protein